MTQSANEIRSYRYPRSSLYQAIARSSVFLAFGIGSTFMVLFNSNYNTHRGLAACLIGLFWLLWVLLGLWDIATYLRFRVTSDTQILRKQSLLRDRSIQLSRLRHIQWRADPLGGSVLLDDGVERMKLDLTVFSDEGRQELIELIRRQQGETAHEGWTEFSRIAGAPSRQPSGRDSN